MTNKKFKLAATAVALTACVAAQPLAAHATTADEVDAAPADAKQENVAADENQQTPAEEAPVNKEDPKKATPVLGEGETEVKYDHENPIQNSDGTTLKGDIIKKDESTEEKPEVKPEEKPEEKVSAGETTEEKKDLTEEGEKIGKAKKTEKVDTETTEQKPNPGAEPIPDKTKESTTDINLDGSLTRKDPVVTPGTETSTTTGTGNAKADLDPVVTETPKENIDLEKELGKVNPDIAWDAAKGTDVGNNYKVQEVKNDETGTKQTLVLRKEETKTGEMTAEEIAKLLEADKPTVNADGSYTLTRTEKYLDEKGNEQTRTTNITVTGSTVTIKTTTDLTVSREKFENDGEAGIPTDVVLAEVKLNNGESLPYTKLDEMLTEKGGKDASGVKDGEYTYTETAEDGTVREYTIKIDTTSTEQLSNDEIVAKLNNDRYSVEGGDIYYRADNGERVKLTVDQNTALRRNLSIEVSVTETKKGTTEAPDKEKAENEVKDAALREALYKAACGMTTDEAARAELKKAIDAGTFNRDEGGVFTATVDGKTYSFEYYGAKVETTVTDAVDPTVPGKDPDKITDVKDNTLAGSALVTYGKVSWTDTETGKYHEVTGDAGTVIPTPMEGNTTAKYDDQGRLIGFDEVTTDKNGHTVTTTYYITYSTLTDAEKEALAWDALLKEHPGKTKADLIAEGYKDVRFEGDVTKAEWTVTKKTEGTDVTTETPNKVLVAEGSDNWTFNEDKSTLTTADGKVYTKGADGKYTLIEKDGDKTTTYTVTVKEEALTDEAAIKAMLAKEFGIDADKITLKDKDGKKTATYTDGKTTVTIDYSNLKKNTLTIDKSVDESMQTTVDAKDQAALNKAYEDFWADILAKYDNLGKDEELWVGDIQVKGKDSKEEVITYLKTSVTHADMTPEQLIKALNDQKKLAQNTTVKVNEGTYYEETLKNYYSGKGDFEHKYTPWYDYYGVTKGDYISHLDLASSAKLDLLPGEDGKTQTTDCVLVNPKLEWNYSAEHLLADQSKLDWKDRNVNVGLDNKISYDTANGEKEGHYEYDRGNNNKPTSSAFYKVTGTVAYDAVKDENGKVKTFSGWNAEADAVNAYLAAVKSDKNYYTLTDKEKQEILSTYVVKLGDSDSNPNSPKGYQVYTKSSTMTAYGYMTRDANVCTNATASKQKNSTEYVGGYDLMISKLVQVREGQVVGENQSSIKTLFAPISVRSTSTKTNRSMTVDTKTTSTPVEEWATAGWGTQTDGEYKCDVDREKERSLWQFGCSDGGYKSFTNLIRNVFTGKDTGKQESGFIKYLYYTEKNANNDSPELKAKQMVTTVKKDAAVDYTYTTVEVRDVLIPGVIETVLPAGDDEVKEPDAPAAEEVTPAAPEASVTPAAPETPAAPAAPAADATISALPKTGVNWTGALGSALSGMALMVVGAFTSLKYKEKH